MPRPKSLRRKKATIDALFDCRDLSILVASVIDIIPQFGQSQSKFYICSYEGIRFLFKLGFYKKTPLETYFASSAELAGLADSPVDSIPHIDAELKILKLFHKKIINAKVSPCILELVYDKVCTHIAHLSPGRRVCNKLILEYQEVVPGEDLLQAICKYNDLVDAGLAHDKCAFLVMEQCDMDLHEYLRKGSGAVGTAIFLSLIFMIIYTFYSICKIYPGFRHRDLHTSNILLKFNRNFDFSAGNMKFLVFNVGHKQFAIPYFGVIPKIIDFGYSTIPEEGIVSNIVEDKLYMYYHPDNDLVLLFHWIYRALSTAGAGDRLVHIDKILSTLEPNRVYVTNYVEHIKKVADKIPTYEEMLHNKIFSRYSSHKVPATSIYMEYTAPS